MDKESVILKYEQIEVAEVALDLEDVDTHNEEQGLQLDVLREKIKFVCEFTGKNSSQQPTVSLIKSPEAYAPVDVIVPTTIFSYDQLFQKASSSLAARGLDVDSLDYHSLVSEEELAAIEKELNRPLPRREKWTKGDFIVVFIAAAIGSLADIILCNRDNVLTGKKSDFSEWLNQFHDHKVGAPIDYQGPDFGGGFHRGLSKGHDILRFIEGIMMFQSGQFEAVRYANGIAHTVSSTVNQFGNPYKQLEIVEAIVQYAKHMFADLFSTCSLPFPGSSFLIEADDRAVRKFAADMYQNGFNIKNIMCQGLSTIVIEIILRIYFSIQSAQKYKDEFELDDNYSNFEVVKHFFKPENKDKLEEMLLVAHSIVTAVNIGKVVIDKAPWEINVTEICSVIRYGAKVVNKTIERNSEYAKLMRSAGEIHEGWQKLEDVFGADEKAVITASQGLIVI